MNKLPLKEIVKLIENCCQRYNALDSSFSVFEDANIEITGSDIYNASWAVFDEYVSLLSEAMGDKDGWLQWWLYTTDQKGGSVKMRGESCEVVDIDGLARVVWGQPK